MKELSHRLTLAVLFAFTLCAQIPTLPDFAPPKMTAAEEQSARNGLPFHLNYSCGSALAGAGAASFDLRSMWLQQIS